jgi:hypothetical protein
MRLTKRKALAYGICALVFAGTVTLALRLSGPPDPFPRIHHLRGARVVPVHVKTHKDIMRVEVGKDTHTYRLLRTKEGLAAERLEDQARR